MRKEKVEIEIDVPDGCEFDGVIKNVEGVVYQTNEYRQEIILKFKEIKPAKKVIDLSCIVGSGIDCEFRHDGESWAFGQLIRIERDRKFRNGYLNKYGAIWGKCRIRQSPHVHFWGGGDKCPLPEGLEFKIYFRDGGNRTVENELLLRWRHTGAVEDIIGFEILGTAPGWRYEWDEE